MILVVLGTDEHPFDRALDVISPVRTTDHLVIQHGFTARREWPDVVWHKFVPYEDVVRLMTDARAVISHGGAGTIMTALSAGKRPVAIPRRAKFGEHVDDHQLQIVTELAANSLLVTCEESSQITQSVDDAARLPTRRVFVNSGRLREAVAEAVPHGESDRNRL